MRVLDRVGVGVLLALCGPLRAGASPGPDLVPDPGSGFAIVGGRTTEANEFPTVVAVVAGTALCTGTLVAKNLVLTAGHCLVDLPPSTQVVVYYGSEITQMRAVLATSFGSHPEFCATCEEDIYDYGYVVTTEDFSGPFTPPISTQTQWDDTMALGGEITLVGFGEDPDTPGESAIGIKRSVTTTISRFSAAGLEFFAGGDDRDSCQGDSGGPAFVTLADGSLRLAGITSRGSNPCGKGGYYGTPYPALCWVREETGVDLLDGECSACDCVDTSPPPPKEEGCGCRSDGSPSGSLWAGLWALAWVALRRRPAIQRGHEPK